MTYEARQEDADFVYRSLRIALVWLAIIVAAGVALIVFGDTLMNVFA